MSKQYSLIRVIQDENSPIRLESICTDKELSYVTRQLHKEKILLQDKELKIIDEHTKIHNEIKSHSILCSCELCAKFDDLVNQLLTVNVETVLHIVEIEIGD